MMWNVEVVQILVLFDAVMEPDSAKGWSLPCSGRDMLSCSPETGRACFLPLPFKTSPGARD